METDLNKNKATSGQCRHRIAVGKSLGFESRKPGPWVPVPRHYYNASLQAKVKSRHSLAIASHGDFPFSLTVAIKRNIIEIVAKKENS